MDSVWDFITSEIPSEILENSFWLLANLTAFNIREMEVIIKEYRFHLKGIELLSLYKSPLIVENIVWFLTNCACISTELAQEIAQADIVRTLRIFAENKLTRSKEVTCIVSNLLHYLSL